MANEPRLIIQIPVGSAVERWLSEQPPRCVVTGDAVVLGAETDAMGNLEASTAGEVVLSVASPEALAREADEVRRVVELAGTGAEPLVIAVEAADELRDDELDAVLEASGHSSRAVILRIVRDG